MRPRMIYNREKNECKTENDFPSFLIIDHRKK
ncbi:hypothetical protein AB205_0052260 [Aquarana catesbeiana]|uniref:Uncharacterized protein n=1 Tax=Aquarana catesbeiana TaxID=8400 RepID=A0A2G9RHX8_AQUCT|nr:hypothetical protein AB205_0052260 [Aquarana catesbeiana]